MSNPAYTVEFTVSTDQVWSLPLGGLLQLVPASATITEVFQPGYYFEPPETLGDPVTATWQTTDPGSGWIRVTDPEVVKGTS